MNINKYIKQYYNQIDDSISKDQIRRQKLNLELSYNELKFYQLILYCSNYLKKIINNEFDFFVLNLRNDCDFIYNNLCNQIYNLDLKNIEIEEFKKQIRLIKRKINIFIALISIVEEKNIEEIGVISSKFADLLIKSSLQFSIIQYYKDNPEFFYKEIDVNNSGFFLIALGKLGSYDLNYSSDIDLIFFFDNEKIKNYLNKNPGYHLNLIIKNFINILSDVNEFDFVYRTDFRLRPDPGMTPLAISTISAENYYFGLGQNWERAALIRSRFICGDKKSFENFFIIIKKFIWRPTLDFFAIDDIKSIKNQIDVTQKSNFKSLLDYNIKIGKGGIREIEFYVHILQLIWGGKYINLQTSNLIESIKSLFYNNLINKKIKNVLINNYFKLRNLENRIQMLENSQNHLIPKNKEIYNKLILFYGYLDKRKFEIDFIDILRSTRSIFKDLFKDDKPLNIEGDMVFTGVEPEDITIKSLIKLNFDNAHQVWKLISSWHYGRYRIMQSEKSRQLLTILIPDLLASIAKTPYPNETLYRFDIFLKNISYGVHVLSLLKENNKILLDFLSILGISPKLGQYMSANVNLVESFLQKDFFKLEKLENYIHEQLESIKNLEGTYEKKVIKFSSLINEIKFQIGVNYLLENTNIIRSQELLSYLAITSLKVSIDIVFYEYKFHQTELSNCEFGVIGFGGIAKKSINYESDLDLVYVFNYKNNKKYDPNKIGLLFDSFVKRLELFLTYKAINSSVYEIDTRLRPYGVSGAKVINLDTMQGYYTNKAWNWEKLALAGAQLIVGSRQLFKVVDNIKNQCLKKINLLVLIKEINEMREKLTIKNVPINYLDLKHRKGGIRDITFVNQLLILLNINNINKRIDEKNYFSEIIEIRFLSSILFDPKSLTNIKIEQFEKYFLKRINKQKILKNEISIFLKKNNLIYRKLFNELKI